MEKINIPSTSRSQKILGRANCAASDAVGHCVKISAPQVDNYYNVTRMNPYEVGTSQAVGVIVKKYTSTTCSVHFSGPLVGLHTALIPGTQYWVAADSTLTSIKPLPSSDSVLHLQAMGIATSTDEILIAPQAYIIIPEMHGVLDTLTHLMAENCHVQVIRSSGRIVNITAYTDASETVKIRESQITRTGGFISQLVIIQYDYSGNENSRITGNVMRIGGRVDHVDWVVTTP